MQQKFSSFDTKQVPGTTCEEYKEINSFLHEKNEAKSHKSSVVHRSYMKKKKIESKFHMNMNIHYTLRRKSFFI